MDNSNSKCYFRKANNDRIDVQIRQHTIKFKYDIQKII
jgi:hypothetical protein